MTRARMLCLIALFPLFFTPACDDAGDGTTGAKYDPATLAEYRAALPSSDTLHAPALGTAGAGGGLGVLALPLVGDPAVYPALANPVVQGVNGAVGSILGVLDLFGQVEPTLYDSEKKEFYWGPYENEDGVGYNAFAIHDNGTADDFRFGYVWARGADRDLANAAAVVWGGATPDPNNKDYGTGATLWDFEANYAFEEAHHPGHGALDRGRFVAVYGRGPDDTNADAVVTFVLSAFRNFVPSDNPAATPGNLDYFYGEVVAPEHTFHFLNFAGEIDIDDGDGDPATETPSAAELLDIRMVFIDEGVGRAEVMATGGDFASNPDADALVVVECWDASIGRTYLRMTALNATGGEAWVHEEGAETDCGALFQVPLAELGVPFLEDVDPQLRAELDAIATNGVPSE